MLRFIALTAGRTLGCYQKELTFLQGVEALASLAY